MLTLAKTVTALAAMAPPEMAPSAENAAAVSAASDVDESIGDRADAGNESKPFWTALKMVASRPEPACGLKLF